MYRWLAAHPGCFLPKVKEPHYFARFEPTGKLAQSGSVIRDEAAYRQVFAAAQPGQRCGEASPSYLFEAGVAARIAAAQPGCRCIVTVRDPVERAYSQYRMNLVGGTERRPFVEAIEQSIQRGSPSWSDQNAIYIELARYGSQVRRYLDALGQDQVLVVTSHVLASDPLAVMTRIAEFVGIDPAWWTGFDFRRQNEGRVPRNRFIKKVLTSSAARAVGRALVPKVARPFIAERVLSAKPPQEPFDRRVRELIWSELDSEVRLLEQLIGRQLPELWGTYPDRRDPDQRVTDATP